MVYWSLEPFGSVVADDHWRTFATMFYQANSKPGTPIPNFFDRDPKPVVEEDPFEAFGAYLRQRKSTADANASKPNGKRRASVPRSGKRKPPSA